MPKQVSSAEMSTFIYYLMSCSFVGIGLNNLILIAKQDSYISMVLGFIMGFIPLLIYLYIMNHYPNLTITEIINNLFGKKTGYIINIFMSLFILFFATIIFWNLTNLINSQYLSRTPAIVIGIVFIIPMIYILSKGINVIGRTSIMLFYFTIILFILPFFGLFFQVDFDNLLPFMDNGIGLVIKGANQYLIQIVMPIFILLIIPKNMITDKAKLNKRIIYTYILSSLVLFIILFFTISIFGVKLATIYQYPEFHLLKRVSIIGFIQRIESTLAIQWIFNLFMAITLILYFFNTSIEKNFNITNSATKKIVMLISSIFILIVSNYIFNNNTVGTNFLKNFFPIFSFIFFFIVPFLILLLIKFKKNKL